jgi:hypothetical protein
MRSKWVLGLAVAAAGVATGCGNSASNDSGDKTQQSAATPVKARLSIKLTAPANGEHLAAKTVTVRGLVSPEDARVLVLGKPAKVNGGVFQRSVSLDAGANHIDVVATREGNDPATATVEVTRGSAQASAPKPKKPKKKTRPKPTTVAIPDEVGERLDVAKSDLSSSGLRAKEIGGGTFGVVVESNWTVCEMKPGAGTQVAKHSRVKLIIDRDC